MLNFKEKVEILNYFLNQEEISYADSFNADIAICSSNYDYNFLEKLKSKKEIIHWIEKLKSRIVMRENEDLTEEIINDYIMNG